MLRKNGSWRRVSVLTALTLVVSVVGGVLPLSAETQAQQETAVTAATAVARSMLPGKLQEMVVQGVLSQLVAGRTSRPRELTQLDHRVQLSESLQLNEAWKFKSVQRLTYDAVFDLADNFPDTVEADEQLEFDLRETYLDYSGDAFDLRLGKQTIVWGDAVGLFFADVVNAKDLREYVLPDFDQIRIPQWGADLEFSKGDGYAELIWLLPDVHKLGVSGSEFEFPLLAPATAARTARDPGQFPMSVSNSEVGTRVAYLLNGWDVSAFFLYTWDKFPVMYRAIQGDVYRFDPRYERAHLVGGSFSKDLGDFVLKGEMVVNPSQHLSILDPTDDDGIVERTVVDYLIGTDYRGIDRLEVNVQLMQRVIQGFDERFFGENDWRTHLSIWLRTSMLDGKVEPEFLAIVGLSEEDALFRPQVKVNLTDRWQWRVGVDVFQGEASGVFGRFDKKSRVFTEFRYHF